VRRRRGKTTATLSDIFTLCRFDRDEEEKISFSYKNGVKQKAKAAVRKKCV